MVTNDFAYRLMLARGSAGLTQAELASQTKVHRKTVSSWETRGKLTPRATTLAALCRVLRVSPEWLLNGEGVGPYSAKVPLNENEAVGAASILSSNPALDRAKA
jgi:transcriptional regulator with XRE-family HTH domain